MHFTDSTDSAKYEVNKKKDCIIVSVRDYFHSKLKGNPKIAFRSRFVEAYKYT